MNLFPEGHIARGYPYQMMTPEKLFWIFISRKCYTESSLMRVIHGGDARYDKIFPCGVYEENRC